MTDKELKKSLKKLIKIFILMIFIIILLNAYIFSSKKATLSIYENTEYANSVEIFGIDKEELEKYLSIFGVALENDEKNDNVIALNLATKFIDDMLVDFDDENDTQDNVYDADLVNQIAKEIKGIYLSKKTDIGKNYVYNFNEKQYVKNISFDKIPYCIEIEDVVKNEEKIDITYKLANLTSEQLAKYKIEKNIEFEFERIKVSILKNEEYEYSKYYLYSIEKI